MIWAAQLEESCAASHLLAKPGHQMALTIA